MQTLYKLVPCCKPLSLALLAKNSSLTGHPGLFQLLKINLCGEKLCVSRYVWYENKTQLMLVCYEPLTIK